MHRLILVISTCFSLLFMFLANGFAADRLSVFVSVVPQKYFVEQIGKDLVDVQVMVQPGASPATYEPKPRQMADLAQTDLYFAIGVPFENAWLNKIAAANPDMKVIHTDDGIKKRAMAAHEHENEHENEAHADEQHESDHDHEEGEHYGEADHDSGHHGGAGLDPHIWLSPPLVKVQARAILTALSEADPANRDTYETNFSVFTAQIDRLDAELKKIFSGKEGMQFMVFHPSWGYFAHAYGLEQVPIEIEGKNPKPAQLQKLIQHARENGIQVVFVQPQFSAKSAELVAREIDGEVVFVNPLAESWVDNLRQVAEKFDTALK